MPPAPLTKNEIESVAHPAEDFPADRTVVWSPIFQAAWDRLNEELGGPPLTIEPENALMDKLDTFAWQADRDLPPGAWRVWSGPCSKEFIEEANREAALMLGETEGPFKRVTPFPPPSLAVLALLDRNPAFAVPFKPDPIALRFHGAGGESQTVRSFGPGREWSDHEESLLVLHYGPDSKAVRIAVRKEEGKEDEGEEWVVLYLPPQRENFGAAWSRVKGWLREGGLKGEYMSEDDPCLHFGDLLCMPYLGLDVASNLTARLKGDRYHVAPNNPWRIGEAWLSTKFKMTEKGVELRAVAEICAVGGSATQPVPRDLRFDRPYFVFLCRDGSEWPYFGGWFGDHAALTGAPEPELIRERDGLQVFRLPDSGEEYIVRIPGPRNDRRKDPDSNVVLRYVPPPGAGVQEAFVLQRVFPGMNFGGSREELLEDLRAGNTLEVSDVPRLWAERLVSQAAESGLILELVEEDS